MVIRGNLRREKGNDHENTALLGSRMTAAATAFALSLVLIGGTVSVPSAHAASTIYMGAIA